MESLAIEADEELNVERRLIEFFDRTALERIAQRFGCNERIAVIKYGEGYSIFDPTREAELIGMMEREFRNLPPGFVRDYYALVFRYSKGIMQGVVDGIESSS